MTTTRTKVPTLLIFLGIVLGIYLLYIFVIAAAKVSVYLGYNFFFFTDNMLETESIGPMLSWGILGLFIGSIAGVLVAVKKYKLSMVLVLYPVGATVALIATMILLNKPGEYAGELTVTDGEVATSRNTDTTAPAIKYYYTAAVDVYSRTGPSLASDRALMLSRGDEVEVLERKLFDNRRVEWLKVKYHDREVYVNSKYVRFSRTGIK